MEMSDIMTVEVKMTESQIKHALGEFVRNQMEGYDASNVRLVITLPVVKDTGMPVVDVVITMEKNQ